MEKFTLDDLIPGLTAADKIWLETIPDEDKLAALAFIRYKMNPTISVDKKSRSRLFMDAFTIGCACAEKILSGEPAFEENTPRILS